MGEYLFFFGLLVLVTPHTSIAHTCSRLINFTLASMELNQRLVIVTCYTDTHISKYPFPSTDSSRNATLMIQKVSKRKKTDKLTKLK